MSQRAEDHNFSSNVTSKKKTEDQKRLRKLLRFDHNLLES